MNRYTELISASLPDLCRSVKMPASNLIWQMHMIPKSFLDHKGQIFLWQKDNNVDFFNMQNVQY